ncbi:hypothetical protein [Streptomyces sp. NPDC026673]|uniref:hypothetical protein n=1 Tax=Streptomyces sp. NPDC026673 TaxID=3155724 RepID=UPI0033C47BC6
MDEGPMTGVVEMVDNGGAALWTDGGGGPVPPAGVGAGAPAPCAVPLFAPIRAGGGRHRLGRALRRRRRMLAAGLAMTAAALAAAAPRTDHPQSGRCGREGPAPAPAATAREMVRAPVRIADAAAAGLVRPGDRVDILAAARVVARAAPVLSVPSLPSATSDTAALSATGVDGGGVGGGALIVLSVPRRTAAALSGAAAASPLAVALR